jgi:hypothetical protein
METTTKDDGMRKRQFRSKSLEINPNRQGKNDGLLIYMLIADLSEMNDDRYNDNRR